MPLFGTIPANQNVEVDPVWVQPGAPSAPDTGELWWDTDEPAAYPGQELAYNQITANVVVSGTSSATATTVVTAPATTFDGSPIIIECCAPYIQTAASGGAWLQLCLYDGSTALGIIGFVGVASPSVSLGSPFYTRKRLTPTAGSHTYSFRSFIAGGNGTVGAGAGAIDQYQPAFIRVTRV